MTKIFTQVLLFFIESFTLNEIWELKKISPPTAAFKEDTNMLSTEFIRLRSLVFDYGYTIKLLLTD